MRRLAVAVLAALILGACTAGEVRLVVAAGTTVVDSGFIDHVVASFEEAHPDINVSVVGEPTRLALELGRNGAADVTITHAPAQETRLVDGGHVLETSSVFVSKFLLVGPPSLSGRFETWELPEVLRAVFSDELVFVAGQLVDTVGGGVSQFATTFYNAVFWGGFEDVEHHAHSYYFRRYPEGIEATVNWRTPDLVFRNNYESALLIDTQYTRNSITVRFFGYNDGRIVKGEQSGGRTRIEVVAEGGPNALHVEGIVGRRFGETDPPEPLFVANPEFAVDQVEQLQEELGGWSVRVTRRILRGGTELVEEQEWVVRYLPKFAVFEVHPCMMPETEETCPSTTTLATSTTGG